MIMMIMVIACNNYGSEQDYEYYHRDMIEDYVFIAKDGIINLDTGITGQVSGLIVWGEFIYYIFTELFYESYESEEGNLYFTYDQYIHVRGIDKLGNIAESISVEVSEHHFIDIVGFNKDANGEFVIIIQAHNSDRTDSTLYHEKYNSAGDLLNRIELLPMGGSRFGIDAVFDESGCFAVREFSLQRGSIVHIWDDTLTYINYIPLVHAAYAFGIDGTILRQAEQFNTIQIVEIATGEVVEEHYLLLDGLFISGIYSADETSRFDFYIRSTQYLYGFFLDTGETEYILDFLESNLLLSAPGDIFVTATEGRVVVAHHWWESSDMYGVELSVLTPTHRFVMEGIDRIVLAGFGFSPHTIEQVMAYNRRNPFQQIIIRDYFDLSDGVDFRQAVGRLHFDILAGEMPDVIRLGVCSYSQELRDALIMQGFLSDLYRFIDLDPEISRDDFFPNILRGLEDSKGGLPAIGNRFAIVSMVSTDPGVTREYWTFDKFLDVMEDVVRLGNAEPLGAEVTGVGFVLTILELMSYEFIDHYAGNSNFDSELFIRLLELAAKIPENPDYAHWWWNPDPDWRRVASGEEFVDLVEFFWLHGWVIGESEAGMPEDFSFEFEYIGLPSAGEGIHRAYVTHTFGIFDNSQSKDTAWQFIRDTLLPGATGTSTRYIPLRTEDFEANLTAMSISADIEETLRDLINNATVHWIIHGTLRAVIEEGVTDFITGRHTAEEAARIIQSRVSVYLAERG